ncbi:MULTISPECIES: hypothetical protein [unclassified Klebsiella]|uniref:hypothetical protein n=1 Tax=unclassified Klebsiella TaxID=2608929 RepID=UPI00105547EE|nr:MULTISPECIES: hypothetical protein [unclassified Klebsiella]
MVASSLQTESIDVASDGQLMGFPREGRYHERVVRTENYMINAGDDVMGGYCRKHALFLSEKLLAKEGHRRGIG